MYLRMDVSVAIYVAGGGNDSVRVEKSVDSLGRLVVLRIEGGMFEYIR